MNKLKLKNSEGKEIEVNIDDFDIEIFNEVSLALCDFVKDITIHCDKDDNENALECSKYCKDKNLHHIVSLSEIFKIYKKLKEQQTVRFLL